MDESIVLVIVLAVVSMVGSMAKRAQTKMDADKRKSAAGRVRSNQSISDKKDQQQTFRPAVGAQTRSANQPREAMQPFAGAARTGDFPMQPQMSAFPDDNSQNRRIVPDETNASFRNDTESTAIEMDYDRESLLRGIIFAEVLRRPKPGDARRLPADRR